MCDAIGDCLAVEGANVEEGGSPDGESFLAVPNDVSVVGLQAFFKKLWE